MDPCLDPLHSSGLRKFASECDTLYEEVSLYTCDDYEGMIYILYTWNESCSHCLLSLILHPYITCYPNTHIGQQSIPPGHYIGIH